MTRRKFAPRHTRTSYTQHHLWSAFVAHHERSFRDLLAPGERIVGEWLTLVHSTRYDSAGRSPFVAFDVMSGNQRLLRARFLERVGGALTTPGTLDGPHLPEHAVERLDHHGADRPEGVVYRVESEKRGIA